MNTTTRTLLNLQALEFEPPRQSPADPEPGIFWPAIQRLRSRVTTQVLREYDTRKRRYGAHSLVPIHEDSCTGCQVRLSVKTRRLALERVTECEHCARLLYNPSRPRQRMMLEL